MVNTELKAQIIEGSVLAGMNISQVDGDEVFGFKRAGLHLGAAASVPFSNNWDVTLETLFSQKGAKGDNFENRYADSSIIGDYRLRLDYLEVPVLIHYTDKNFIALGAGFSWGRLVNVKEEIRGEDSGITNQSGEYSINDWSVLAEVKLRLYRRLWLHVRYAYSIVPIRTRDYLGPTRIPFSRDQFNNVISIRLAYVFNEQQIRRTE